MVFLLLFFQMGWVIKMRKSLCTCSEQIMIIEAWDIPTWKAPTKITESILASHGMVVPLGSHGTLLAYAPLANSQNPRSLSAGLPSLSLPSLYIHPGLPHPRYRSQHSLSFSFMPLVIGHFVKASLQDLSASEGVNSSCQFSAALKLSIHPSPAPRHCLYIKPFPYR